MTRTAKYIVAVAVLCLWNIALYSQGNINAMEYYIDNDDLGAGANTSIPITNGAIVTESFTISTLGLSEGFHTIYFRVQDMGGQWGVPESRTFYIGASNLNSLANIINIEYYIDTDPGYGAATSIGPFASNTVNTSPNIPTSGLPVGFHTIGVRAMDADGVWGETEIRSFYIVQSNISTSDDITELRYYIDDDPGYGNGILIPITNSSNININLSALTSALSAGHHVLHIRAMNASGIWSHVESRPFYMDAFSSGLITGVEYFYNTDPGYGSGNTFSITPAVASVDQVIDLPTTSLAAGPHELGLRMITDTGVIGMTDYYPINLCATALPDFVPNVVCVGSTTTFADNSTGVLGGDIYSWDFDGDGFEDSNTSGVQSFSYSTDGTFTASLTIDRAGCISTTQVTVTVAAIPISDAGVDLSFCADNTVLSANTPNAGETGMWSLVSGSGTFTNASDPNTTFTGIASVTNQLRWTVTNTLGGCFTSDDVVLTSNLAISAVDQTTTVDIGQSINLDVQTSATINSGDVLTTSITTSPLNGIATVQANGTIDYTPDEDAPSTDSFVFRITNQCSNFDEKSIQITILNQAPIIDATGFTATPNALELVFDLTTLISDPNNNLDFNTLRIVTQPRSGAVATIDANGVLNIDYSGVTFSGDDEIEIEICDLLGVCTIQTITIPNVEVGGEDPPITVFNAISPNGDDRHDFMEIENIEAYSGNQVIVFNRWGDVVYETIDYNNLDNNFIGQTDGGDDLPSGTYYYSIDLKNGTAVITGFVMLNK